MTLTINTNMTAMKTRDALTSATSKMNTSIERMTTGLKINSAKDDAAGMAVATKMDTKVSAVEIAQSNLQLGESMLGTMEGNYDILESHLQRIRDLTTEGANGTYSTDSRAAIQSEISQRMDEITRLAKTVEYNDMNLLDGSLEDGLDIQVGITSSSNAVIKLEGDLFKSVTATSLLWQKTDVKNTDGKAVDLTKLGVSKDGATCFARICSGAFTQASADSIKSKAGGADLSAFVGTAGANQALATIDAALKDISDRKTTLGATENRLDSANDALTTQSENLTSSLSTVRDADVATESSSYITAQILQQASASLLSTANQTPSIALNLV